MKIGSQAWLEADGGVKPGNAAEVVGAGAVVLVAGSAIFKSNVAANVQVLRAAIHNPTVI